MRTKSSPSRWDRRANVIAWCTILGTWAVMYASQLLVRTLFYADTRFYMAMSYWFGGESQDSARNLTATVSESHGMPMPDTATVFGWGLVQPRVVLPALSAPFVRIFGPDGMLVVPGLATLAFVVLVTWLLLRRYGPAATTATMLLMLTSIFVMSYMTGMLTESLSALWTALTLAAAWRYLRTPRWYWLAAMAGLTVVSAFTRQATLIVTGAFVVAWLADLVRRRGRRSGWTWPAVTVTATTLVSQAVQSSVFPTFSQKDQFLRMTGTDSLPAALAKVPGLVGDLVRRDFQNYMSSDRPLLLLVLLSLVAAVVCWRRTEAHLLLGAGLGFAVYNITNGNATWFRYAVPGLVFYLLTIALLMSLMSHRLVAARHAAGGDDPGAAPAVDPGEDPVPQDDEVAGRHRDHADGLGEPGREA